MIVKSHAAVCFEVCSTSEWVFRFNSFELKRLFSISFCTINLATIISRSSMDCLNWCTPANCVAAPYRQFSHFDSNGRARHLHRAQHKNSDFMKFIVFNFNILFAFVQDGVCTANRLSCRTNLQFGAQKFALFHHT